MFLIFVVLEFLEIWFGLIGIMENFLCELFREVFEMDLFISGGWGYFQDNCVVIDKDDGVVDQEQVFDGLVIESEFVKFCFYLEFRVFRELGDMF